MEPELFYGLVREPNKYVNRLFEKLKSLVDFMQPVYGVSYEFLIIKKVTEETRKQALTRGMYAHMIEYDKLWGELVKINRKRFYIESMPVIKTSKPINQIIKSLNEKPHAHLLIHSNGVYSQLEEINELLLKNNFSFSVFASGLAELIIGFEINPKHSLESIDKFVTKIREGLLSDLIEVNMTTTITPMLFYCNKP